MTTARTVPAREDVAWAAAVSALAIAAFAMTIGYQFVYDDVRIIVERPDLQDLSRWREILAAPWWNDELYRPLTRLSLAFDWTVSDGSPALFHAVNVLAHGAVTAGVYAVARAWVGRPAAGIAAALFAIHPVHVEAVASVVGRAEIFATGFTLLAVLAYRWDGSLAQAADGSWRRAVASFGTLGALVAGLASKESAFAIPGLLLLVDWLEGSLRGHGFAHRVKTHLPLWAACLVVAVGWLVLRADLLGTLAGDKAGPGLYGQGFANRLLIMAPVFLEYVRLLVFPLELSADYSPDFLRAEPALTFRATIGFAVLLLFIWAAIAQRRDVPVVTTSLAWLGGTLLIVSNLIVPSGVLLAERSLYLPSVGLLIGIGWVAQDAWSGKRRRLVIPAVILVLALGFARTVTRAPVWRNQDTFFPALVRDAPGSFRSQWVAAMLLYTSGDRTGGEEMLRAALTTYPLFPNTWQDYGNRLQEEGRWNEAARAFAAMYRIDSTRTHAAARAVSNFMRAGNLDSAGTWVERLRAADPHDAFVQVVIGDFALATGRPMEAMTWFRRATWQTQDNARLHYRTAEAAARAEYCPQFQRSLNKLVAIDGHDQHLPELYALGERAGCDVPETDG